MSTDEIAARRVELLKKRWSGCITSEEQDELDNLSEALRMLFAGTWEARHRSLAVDVAKRDRS